jgi:hypothetical protein
MDSRIAALATLVPMPIVATRGRSPTAREIGMASAFAVPTDGRDPYNNHESLILLLAGDRQEAVAAASGL